MNNKIVIIGTGFVGTTAAFTLMNSNLVNEIVLIDVDKDKVKGEELDLLNSEALLKENIDIHVGNYEDCKDAIIVIITAGVSNQNGTSRLELVNINKDIITDITKNVVKSGFDGIFVVATNPVDIMAYLIKKVSNFDKSKVIGTGTLLDTARLKYLLSEKYDINDKYIDSLVIAEHGDSSLIPWEYIKINKQNIDLTNIEKDDIHKEVINMGYDISNKKNATYYGIAMCISKIVNIILEDKNEVIPVSTYLNGEYDNYDVYTSVPCIVNKTGIKEIVNIKLNKEEQDKLNSSCLLLKNIIEENNI